MIPLQLAVATKQLDIKCFLEEHGERPPVACIDRASLEQWQTAKGFEIDEINSNCVRLWEPSPANWKSGGKYSGYDQIWVKKTYTRYRDVMIDFLTEMVGQDCDFSDIDADHVVAQVRLEHFENSWVNIFPVRRSWNMFFGGAEPKQIYRLCGDDFDKGIYYATGFECLKILLNDIEAVVNAAKGALIVDNEVIRNIRAEMGALKHL